MKSGTRGQQRSGSRITSGQVKLIKTLARAAGLEDDDYRLMLWGQARVKSCKDLAGAQVERVIRHLQACAGQGPKERERGAGARGREGAPFDPRAAAPPVPRALATDRQHQEIRRLWGQVTRAEAGNQEEALKVFLRTRFKVQAFAWLTLLQAQKVIQALQAMAGRGNGSRD
jgi:hypothetical protein